MNPLQRIPPHVVKYGFLSRENNAALLEWALAHESELEPSPIGREDIYRADARNSTWIRRPLPEAPRAALRHGIRALLPELLDAVGLAPFPVDGIELSLVVYNDGAFYRRHVDTAPGGVRVGKRMLTGVYYFHAEPRGFSGGALRLHPLSAPPEGAAQYVEIAPEQNSLAVFPSWAPHEVRPVACPSGLHRNSRFAINCWVLRGAGP